MADSACENGMKFQLRRLQISSSDLLQAYQYAEVVIATDLHESNETNDKLILRALSLAMVVAYARPFLNNRTDGTWQSTASVSGSILRALTSDERSFHDRLIRLRNQELAHSDASALNLKMSLRTPPDGSAERVAIGIMRDTGRPLDRAEVQQLITIVEKLSGAIQSAKTDLHGQLPDAEQF